MPNENISCASTGNSSQSSSTRKDKKPLKIRASLSYEDSSEKLQNPEFPDPPADRQPGKVIMRAAGFDASFSVHIGDGPDSGAIEGPDSAFEQGIARGFDALYHNILSVNAPDKYFELISVEAIGLRGDTVNTLSGSDEFLEAQCLKLKQLLETAGYSVQKIELRVSAIIEKSPVFAAVQAERA